MYKSCTKDKMFHLSLIVSFCIGSLLLSIATLSIFLRTTSLLTSFRFCPSIPVRFVVLLLLFGRRQDMQTSDISANSDLPSWVRPSVPKANLHPCKKAIHEELLPTKRLRVRRLQERVITQSAVFGDVQGLPEAICVGILLPARTYTAHAGHTFVVEKGKYILQQVVVQIFQSRRVWRKVSLTKWWDG